MTKATRSSEGTVVSSFSCISTIATCAHKFNKGIQIQNSYYKENESVSAYYNIPNLKILNICKCTIAKPDIRAEVLLMAFSLARLKCSFRQDRSVAAECGPSPLMLYWKMFEIELFKGKGPWLISS